MPRQRQGRLSVVPVQCLPCQGRGWPAIGFACPPCRRVARTSAVSDQGHERARLFHLEEWTKRFDRLPSRLNQRLIRSGTTEKRSGAECSRAGAARRKPGTLMSNRARTLVGVPRDQRSRPCPGCNRAAKKTDRRFAEANRNLRHPPGMHAVRGRTGRPATPRTTKNSMPKVSVCDAFGTPSSSR